MDIEPDSKDWTWVLERPCPECGLDTRAIDPAAVAGMVRSTAADWAALLRSGPQVRTRPAPATWSPLEYGCHVRDLFGVYDRRLRLMRTEDDPLYPNWDQDETAVAGRYGEQDPVAVAAGLEVAGAALADQFDQVEDWSRPGRRGDGASFTIATFARYFIHDPLHHYRDATQR